MSPRVVLGADSAVVDAFDAVLLAGDANVVRGLGVVLASLAAVRPRPTQVFLLADGLSEQDRSDLHRCAQPPIVLEIIDVAAEVVAEARLPGHLPPAALFRLLMGNLLPSHVASVLYLDADVLVLDDPGSLTPPRTSAVCAVRDPFRPWVGGPPPLPWRATGCSPRSPYFNSGVMLVNLNRWRNESLGERTLEILREHELPFGDQCALNLVLDGAWDAIDPRWNLQNAFQGGDAHFGWVTEHAAVVDQALASPGIVHFTGRGKPWIVGPDRTYHDTWFARLDQGTPWAGWRPPPPAAPGRWETSMTRRVVHRMGRALQRL